jgi:hypothetical protein
MPAAQQHSLNFCTHHTPSFPATSATGILEPAFVLVHIFAIEATLPANRRCFKSDG